MMAESRSSDFPRPRLRDTAVQLALPRRRAAAPQLPPFAPPGAISPALGLDVSTKGGGSSPNPAGGPETAATELEGALRRLELSLAERERSVAESEARVAERVRDAGEMEALLSARERLLTLARKTPSARSAVSPEEKAALEHLRAELERQALTLKEAKDAAREREQFLDASEAKLFEKVQAQQEKENELEQREEDLRARIRRVREREAALDPAAAEALRREDEAAKARDEFRD